MNCVPDRIEAYIDDELDAGERLALERHLATCAECSSIHTRLLEQKIAIKAAAPYYAAPPELRESIRTALHRAAVAKSRPAAQAAFWRPLAIAASLLLVVSIGWNVRSLATARPPSNFVESLLDDHIRSLLAGHLVDVPSSDQHTVKPWFAGKLEFSPDVKNLDAEGFPLVGGRIEYIAGTRVAALVYRHRLHVINVFTWPAESSQAGPAQVSQHGYHVLHWTSGAMTYWAVSDVAMADLELLRKLYLDSSAQ